MGKVEVLTGNITTLQKHQKMNYVEKSPPKQQYFCTVQK